MYLHLETAQLVTGNKSKENHLQFLLEHKLLINKPSQLLKISKLSFKIKPKPNSVLMSTEITAHWYH